MKSKIIIAGGSGFIGQYLTKHLREAGFEVFILSRSVAYLTWQDDEKIKSALNGAFAVINLAGKSVDCRYNAANKKEILDSRVHTTRKLQSLIEQCENPPEIWINSSTATIYRHAEDRPMDEATGVIGSGFSVEVAKAWETAFFEKPLPRTRKVALRVAIVLGRNGGVLLPYINMTRFGLGGAQGNGNQKFSWIHIDDLYTIIRFIFENNNLSGIFNAAAPAPVANHIFMQELRKRIRPLFYFSSPEWLLKMGAALIGTETELVLKSRWVIPAKLHAAGYKFTFPAIDTALDDLLGGTRQVANSRILI